MSGMGELIPNLSQRYPELKALTAVDLCPNMCRKIVENSNGINASLTVLEEDVFNSSLRSESFDCVVSSFGLKTLSTTQQRELAGIVNRILKPGGVFSFIEISLPKYKILRAPLVFYLRYIVPQIGRIFMGNPDSYRMLHKYTENFVDSRNFLAALVDQRLEAKYISHFFGCATGVVGRRVKSVDP
jgi:demethylmenaquinone methyltransferase/2-methoxy-6-polyprenyl-1,4-benzoquinol methylase